MEQPTTVLYFSIALLSYLKHFYDIGRVRSPVTENIFPLKMKKRDQTEQKIEAQMRRTRNHNWVFFKHGPNPVPSYLFSSFSQYNDKYSTIRFEWPNHRWRAWDWFKPWTAGWNTQTQTNHLTFGVPQSNEFFTVKRKPISVIRFGEISPFWHKLKSLGQIFEGLCCIWQNFDPTVAKMFNYCASSHCCRWPNT